MFYREQMILTPGFGRDLVSLLEQLSRDETLCRLLFVLPSDSILYGLTGRVLEVTSHWLQIEAYVIEKPLPFETSEIRKATKTSEKLDEEFYVSTYYIPTQSITSIQTGKSAFIEQITRYLSQRKDSLDALFYEEDLSETFSAACLEESESSINPHGIFSWAKNFWRHCSALSNRS